LNITFASNRTGLCKVYQERESDGTAPQLVSVGTLKINLGVPPHIIQRYLGHRGTEMTSRYAHIHDVAMRDKLSEYLKGALILCDPDFC
jgi:integrase